MFSIIPKAFLSSVYKYTSRVFIYIFALFSVFVLFLVFTGWQRHASGVVPSTDPVQEMKENYYEYIQSESESDYETVDKFYSMLITCILVGEGCSTDINESNFDRSVMGMITNAAALTYSSPPSSGVLIAHESLQNAGFIPDTYAQGIGFYSIDAFMTLWQLFRNIVFLLIVVFLISAGFMIMFRVKIDAQTVIALENTLPRIVVCLLMITFSYAIAGFLIDLTYILCLLIFQIFASSGVPGFTAENLQEMYLARSVPISPEVQTRELNYTFDPLKNELTFFDITAGLSPIQLSPLGGIGLLQIYEFGLIGLFNMFHYSIRYIIYLYLYFFIGMTIFGWVMKPLENFLGNFKITAQFVFGGAISVGKIISYIVSILIAIFFAHVIISWIPKLIAAIGLIFITMNMLFVLIGAYLQIVINIMFAPLILLPSVIPGNQNIGYWFKSLIGNLLVFPIMITLLLAVRVIFYTMFLSGNPGTTSGTEEEMRMRTASVMYDPGAFSLPLISTLDTTILAMVVVGGLFVIIPQLTLKIKKAIIPDPFIDANVSTLFSPYSTGISGVAGQFTNVASLAKVIDAQSPLGKVFNPFLRALGIVAKGDSGKRNTPPAGAVAAETLSGNQQQG